MLRPLTLSAGFALTTSALLIPSTSVEIDQDAEAKAMALAGVMPQTMSPATLVKLDCASCVLEDSKQEDGSGENALLLNFTTSDNALLLNEAQIYPSSYTFQPLRIDLVDANTPIKAQEGDSSNLPKPSISRTATSYSIQGSSSGTDASGHKTTTVTINLYSLDVSPISVDEIHVHLVDLSPAHSLHIQSVTTTSASHNAPSDPNPGNPTTGDAAYKDCSGLPPLLCKWRAILSHKISALKPNGFRKGCAGGKLLKGVDNINNDEATHLPTHIKGIPPSNRFGSHGQHHGGHHGHHHHALRRFLHAFVRAFVGVMIPVLVGVVAGMAASIIGMAIGQLVAFVYMRVRGQKTQTVDYIVVEQEEGRSSLDSEPLPVYVEEEEGEDAKMVGEAPPEYRDVPGIEEGGKKGNEDGE